METPGAATWICMYCVSKDDGRLINPRLFLLPFFKTCLTFPSFLHILHRYQCCSILTSGFHYVCKEQRNTGQKIREVFYCHPVDKSGTRQRKRSFSFMMKLNLLFNYSLYGFILSLCWYIIYYDEF